MKRLLVALALLSGPTYSAGGHWSREGRTVLIQTSERGRKLAVFYSRLSEEKEVLPALRSCVAERQSRYTAVTCLVFDSPALMKVTNAQGDRICWSATAKASGTLQLEVLPDNPALQLAKACGGKTHLP